MKERSMRETIVILIYAVTISACFFLMFLGVLRIFEVNEYFGAEQYKYVESYCEPAGFFGWGYTCDIIAYNKDLGNLPDDYGDPIFNDLIPNISYSSQEGVIS